MKRYLTSALIVSFLLGTTSFVSADDKELNKVNGNSAAAMNKDTRDALTPLQALELLKEGNRRFVENKMLDYDYKSQVTETSKGQYPHSVILSCLDSRTSSELIFDQGLGSIFNARIAGNFENEDILGSMEFACKVAGTKLIAVVGHTHCGAVKGACDNVQMGNLTNVINQIKPSVDATKTTGERTSKNHDFVEAVSRENVLQTIKDIRQRSPILREMEEKGQIAIVGGMYDLETGKVEFY